MKTEEGIKLLNESDLTIISSAIKTPDGTILTSTHVHDFKMYKDTKTGKEYGIDGGCEYQRYLGDIDDCEILITYSNDDFQSVRNIFTWGTYGKNGAQPLQKKKISELSNNHILAIIKTQTHLKQNIKNLFKQEIEYRKNKNILIED